MQSRDTDERAEQFRIERIRQMSPAERVETVVRLSDDTRTIAKDGIRARHPEYSEREVEHALFRMIYGDDLFRRVWPGVPLVLP